jgi:polyisoprenoid-binding protein YceI
MNRLPFARTLTLFAVAAMFPAPASAAETYAIDPSHLSIIFSCGHMNLSYTYGMFRKAQGSYVIDPENPANCQFRLSIDADSLDTNHAERDKHLKSADFFSVREFPTIYFQSTSCARANSQQGLVYQVTGNLTLHGVTRQVTLPVQILAAGPGVDGDQRTGIYCHFELKRSDFGMDNLLNLVGDAVGITTSFEGVMQTAPGAATGAR